MSSRSDTVRTPEPGATTHPAIGSLSIFAIAITSAIPIAGMLWFDWQVFHIALVIWLDGVAKLMLTNLKILTTPNSGIPKFRITAFFTVFFGGFFFGHLAAIVFLLSDATSESAAISLVSGLAGSTGWQLTAAAIFVSHFSAYWSGFRTSGKKRIALGRIAARELTVRNWIVQIGVVVTALLANETVIPVRNGMIVMVLLKTASDVFFEWQERKVRLER